MPFSRENAVAWTEIPVTDMDAAVAFYNKVFDYDAAINNDPASPNPSAFLQQGGVAGHLYPGKPASDGNGPTIHLNVTGTLEDGIARWKDAGGTVLNDPITIPPGRFVYCRDLDGNSIGLFEPAAA